MLKVISFTLCPFVQRVTATLEALNLPYEVDYISLKNKPQWFLELAPHGQVPVLITEKGTALFESEAIIEFLEEEYGSLEPEVSSEQKALDRAWSYLGAKHYLTQCSAMRSKDKASFEKHHQTLSHALQKVENHLSSEHAFFKSNSLSRIDMAWLPILHRADLIKQHTGFDFFADYPKVSAWQQSLLKLDLVEKSVADDFLSVFQQFYLQQTYLVCPQKEQACISMAPPLCC